MRLEQSKPTVPVAAQDPSDNRPLSGAELEHQPVDGPFTPPPPAE
jgi:hypothetical protein